MATSGDRMNKSLKELSSQAVMYALETSNDTNIHNMYIPEVYKEYFAKLIINECAQIADDNYDRGFSPTGLFIKEYFGVLN